MKTSKFFASIAVCGLALVAIAAQAAGFDTSFIVAAITSNPDAALGLSMLGAGTIEQVMKSMDAVEAKLKAMSEKADGEAATLGKISADTKSALDNIGNQQRELAGRLHELEQKGFLQRPEEKSDDSWGAQLVKNAKYGDFAGGHSQKLRVEVKNTLVGSDTNVAPDRKPGIVGGAFQPFSIEALLNSLPTSSNAIEYTRENVFTNNAAEAAEGAQRQESSLTWTLVTQPVSTVAHFIKISKQLAADAPALAAYVNTRMRYGVNQKVDVQLVLGDGAGSNLSGMYKSGNYTAHGYANAALGATLKKLVLIRKIMADLWMAGYPADAIIMNPVDWATIEIELFTTAAGQALYNVNAQGQAFLFGLPVIQAVGMAADTFQVGRFSEAYTLYNREGVVVEMSDSDGDNFQKSLITLRAERRLALATEKPAAVRGGDLTPA